MIRLRHGLATAFAGLALITAQPAGAAEPKSATLAMARDGLLQTPVYVAISRYYPATFDAMVSSLAAGLDQGKPQRELIVQVRPIYLDLLVKEKGKANPANMRLLMRLTRDEAAAALTKGPRFCMGYLDFIKIPELPSEYLPADLQAEELKWAATLFQQTATAPAPPPAPLREGALDAVAVAAYDALPSDAARAAFNGMGGDLTKAKTTEEQAAACAFTIGMIDSLLAQPGDSGPEIYRTLTMTP